MPQIHAPDPHTLYTKEAGTSPLPGYTLLEPLGRGGFGEVWKCEVPGGLHKAIKFVVGGSDRDETLLRQELDAFQQIKTIRHPFLLCLERVELVGDELIMVMGLADRHLGDRFHECESAGLLGIPRPELLGYMREAAEALDVIGTQYGLQHLDVKPANLFLTAGHVQVGDYGLVSKLDQGSGGKNRGLTPKYAAPEVLRGEVHPRSDQYSLALVYQELLTGTFPFKGRTPSQLMLQHVSAAPDLSGLPESDRAAVAVALAKRPEDRFPSCRELVDALAAQAPAGARTRPASGTVPTPGAGGVATPAPVSAPTRGPADADDPTHGNGSAAQGSRLPRLIATKRSVPPSAATPVPEVRTPVPPPPVPPPPAPPKEDDQPKAPGVRLPFVLSIVPVEWLRGREAPDPDLTPGDLVRAVVSRAAASAPPPTAAGGTDGPWSCRVLTTIDPRIARVKLAGLWEPNEVRTVTEDGNAVVFRHTVPVTPVPTSLFGGFAKKAPPPTPAGLEVVVRLHEPGCPVGEVVASGHLYGSPPPEFVRAADPSVRKLFDGVREAVGNFRDRRAHPRVPAAFSVTIFPLHSDGRVERPLSGQCLDVSAGGAAVRTTAPLTTKYAFLAFDGVRGTTGLAVLIQVLRQPTRDNDFVLAGRFRLNLVTPRLNSGK
jgi:serine/threonine protein kinase